MVVAQDWVNWPPELAERYRGAGHWQGLTFGEQLARWAVSYAGRTALVDGGRRWTYAELDVAVQRLCTGLARLGIRRGDRVILQLPNRAEFVLSWFALVRLGAVPVHAMPAHRRSEITHLARLADVAGYLVADQYGHFDYRELAAQVQQDTGLRHVIVAGDPGEHTGFVALAELMAADPEPGPADPPAADDLALLLLSGGTTGMPKLVPRTHDDYSYNARRAAEVCELTEESVYLAVLPIAFNYTMSCPGMLGVLQVGGKVVLAPAPGPQTAFELIEREGVTIAAINPPLVPHWLAEAERGEADLSSLRVLQVGSARLADDLAAVVTKKLDCRLQQVFGMAEGLLCLTRLDDPDDLVHTTQGVPISPDDELRVVDPQDQEVPLGQTGELLTRGPYTLRGYYRAAEHNQRAFTADGFYRTGDLVRLTPTGHVIVVGRAKDQINRGGQKIDATEVEGHLLALPGVVSAALVAEPDPVLGERSVAFLTCTGDAPDAKALTVFFRDRGVAAYKVPDRLLVVDAMPLTAVGKVDKKTLKHQYLG
ncbi:(2,3-dihydroxybenzoyl)adenylate synthase [Goodfellowiella coeruleoviolacea]|uniref:2,3-dihydroxybenzoate-AMP ligase n=1 Tax=Goodfellowiella coeruleoviolacea TaxID=334858 RepID=A0AAE3G7X8_9PSEU|nr:(2,3-dihydroxybenzoyl)adenylate synthase [Goodfellowiella coeruleoviolacea]MCP2163292.1 2,3-dihydroxybenzoate-AMP ligase [Goodfellowiella coeruleoviolacea]